MRRPTPTVHARQRDPLRECPGGGEPAWSLTDASCPCCGTAIVARLVTERGARVRLCVPVHEASA